MKWLYGKGKQLVHFFAPVAELVWGVIAAGVLYGLSWIASLFEVGSIPLETKLVGDQKVVNAIAVGLVGVGALLTLSRKARERTTRPRFDEIDRLGKIVDLSQRADYDGLREAVGLYTSILNIHYTEIRRDALQEFAHQLFPMAKSGESPLLKTSVYVGLEKAEFEQADRGTQVRALATLFAGDLGPSETDEEREYLAANVRFVDRGGDFERLFLVYRDQVDLERFHDAIQSHSGTEPAIPGRLVFVETLLERAPGLVHAAGQGFLLFGRDVGFIDVFDPNDNTRGKVVTDSTMLGHFQKLYQDIAVHAVSISSVS